MKPLIKAMVFSFLVSASARADKTICDERYQTFGDVSKEVKMKELENADVDETWYVPGWMRTNKPEELAWSSFTNIFSTTKNRFRRWDGNQLWPIARLSTFDPKFDFFI